jgi:hypothetical protein
MNWRLLSSVGIALLLRLAVVKKLGWTYRPFIDEFDVLHFGREALLFFFLVGVTLAVVNAILGPAREDQ